MEEKIKIGVDFDSVLANTTESWLMLFNEYTGENVGLEDVHQWDMSKAVKPQYKNLINDLPLNMKLWERIVPVQGSVDNMRRLCDENEVFIVTSTEWKLCHVKMEWLFEQYPFLDKKNVIITSKKHMINVDILIDDNLANLIGGQYKKIILDYAWNRDEKDEDHGIKRCYSWQEIYNSVCEMKKVILEEQSGKNNW